VARDRISFSRTRHILAQASPFTHCRTLQSKMDPAGIGKYGCLKVLKKKTNEFAACFPIDEEEVTFGRNPDCGVRLYYPTVSMFHCKIMFSEGHVSLFRAYLKYVALQSPLSRPFLL
jgi:hypothetical protein